MENSKGIRWCTLGNVNSIIVWIINKYTQKHSTKCLLKNCEAAWKLCCQHSVFYAPNQYFHTEINSQRKHHQHFWTGIRTNTWILTFKNLFTYPLFWVYHSSVTRWWTAFLCRGLVTALLSTLASVCWCVMWKGQPGFCTSQRGEKITPTQRFLYMSKMWTAMRKRCKADRNSNNLTVEG